jgi:hypothetical protein
MGGPLIGLAALQERLARLVSTLLARIQLRIGLPLPRFSCGKVEVRLTSLRPLFFATITVLCGAPRNGTTLLTDRSRSSAIESNM